MSSIKPIAFYLPQYYPIPENDLWWGKGFTEWTNVTKAKPLFKNHEQPNLPSDLGFYDLRVPEARIAQAQLAKEHGIAAFCYWHYWFGNGKRILERPFKEVLDSKEPDFPFCLAWANESWSGIWHGASDNILIEQTYPGIEDFENHFYEMLPAFKDERYITLDDKLIFLVYRPYSLPDPKKFTETWKELAKQNGIKDFYFIGVNYNLKDNPTEIGFNGFTLSFESKMRNAKPPSRARKKLSTFLNKPPYVYNYAEAANFFVVEEDLPFTYFPCVIPNWDNSPRSKLNATILKGSTPQLFGKALDKAINVVKKSQKEESIIFIKSWNEWAEGNYLEPDQKWGKMYLDEVKKRLDKWL